MQSNPSLICRLRWLRGLNQDNEAYSIVIQTQLLFSLLTGPYTEKKWVDEVKAFLCRKGIEEKVELSKELLLKAFLKPIQNSRSHWKYHDTRVIAVDLIVCLLLRFVDKGDTEVVIEYATILGEIIETCLTADTVVQSRQTRAHNALAVEIGRYCSLLQSISNDNYELFQSIIAKWLEKELLLPISLVACLLSSNKSKASNHDQKRLINEKAIDLITKRILNSKTVVNAHTLSAMSTYMFSLDSNVWSSVSASSDATPLSFEATALQTLKKAHEGSARAVSTLVSQLPTTNVDLSAFIAQGGATSALRMIKSATANIRFCGISMFYHMSLRCYTFEGYAALVHTLVEAAQGKGGFVSLSAQRASIFLGLSCCAHNIQSVIFVCDVNDKKAHLDELNKLISGEVLSVLLTCLEKETDATVRLLCAKCITSFIHSFIGQCAELPEEAYTFTLSDALVEAAKSNISKSKPTCQLLLNIFVVVCRELQTPEMIQKTKTASGAMNSMEPLVAGLVGMVKDSLKKPLAVQPEAVLAFELLLRIGYFAVTNSDIGLVAMADSVVTAIGTAKLWSFATAPSSPLHSTELQQSVLLAGFKETPSEHPPKKSKTLNLNTICSVAGLRHLSVYTDTCSLTGTDNASDEELEKEVLLANGAQACAESLALCVPSILALAAILNPSCFAFVNDLTSALTTITVSASINDSCAGTRTDVDTLTGSILFALQHPSVAVRKESSSQLTRMFEALRMPLVSNPFLVSSKKNTDHVAIDKNYGMSVTRNLSAKLLQSFHEGLCAASVTHDQLQLQLTRSINHDEGSTTSRSAVKIPSPATLLNVLITCVTAVLSVPVEGTSTAFVTKLHDSALQENEIDEHVLLRSYLCKIITHCLLVLSHPRLDIDPALCSSVRGRLQQTRTRDSDDSSKNAGIRHNSRLSYILSYISSKLLGSAPALDGSTRILARYEWHLADVLLCLTADCKQHLSSAVCSSLFTTHSVSVSQASQNAMIILIQHSYQVLDSASASTDHHELYSVGHQMIIDYMLPALVTKLEDSEVKNIAAEDVYKYLNPEKAVLDYVAKTEVKDDEIKITNADRTKDSNRASRRGQFGSDRVEDAEWEERIRRDKREKLMLERSGGVLDVHSQARKEVHEAVQRIQSIISQSKCAISCLVHIFQQFNKLQISKLNPETQSVRNELLLKFYSTMLSKVLGPLLAHMSVESADGVKGNGGTGKAAAVDLVAGEAYSCVQVMSHSLLEPDLSDLCSDLAASLRQVAIAAAVGDSSGPAVRLVKSLLSCHRFTNYRRVKQHMLQGSHSLSETNSDMFVSEPSIQLIFVVLKGVLMLHSVPPGCESIFYLLDCLWPLSSSTAVAGAHPATALTSYLSLRQVMLKPMLELVLVTARLHPRGLEPRPEELLRRVLLQENSVSESSGTNMLSMSEWLPLLGENGFLNEESYVRLTCIRALHTYLASSSAATIAAFTRHMNPLLESRLFTSQFDTDKEVASVGQQVWACLTAAKDASFNLSENYYVSLAPLFSHRHQHIRDTAARALAAAMIIYPATCHRTLESMKSLLITNQMDGQSTAASASTSNSLGKLTALPGKERDALPSAATMLASLHRSAAVEKSAAKRSLAPTNISGIGNISSIGMISQPAVKKPAAKGGGLSLGGGLSVTKPKPVASSKPAAVKGGGERTQSLPIVLPSTSSAAALAEQNQNRQFIRQTVASFFMYVGTEKVLLHPSPSVAVTVTVTDDDDDQSSEELTAVISSLLEFILNKGCSDASLQVREQMVAAGRAIIDSYSVVSENHCKALLSIIREVMAEKHGTKNCTIQDADAFDHRHEAGAVFLGSVGKHLSKEDSQVSEIINTLIDTLSTPSESVQKAVADCLAPLIQMIKTTDQAGQLLERLLTRALTGSGYGDRRGGAYGLSACVKGMGIPSLKQYDIVNRLKTACCDGSVNERQGSLMALECLSDRLGLLFEPYVIVIIPILLKSFSHTSDHVREAAQESAKVIMGKLSAHGVKQMLTPVLNSLPEETQWKSRQEAIRLLGMMANCAPKQLATCLPQIIPKLVEAGSDPHPKVKESAKLAMSDIAAVIRSPELKSLSPVLLQALSDPANKTKDALEALLECEFLHSIDTASLALLIPILSRSLKDRLADIKRKGCAIISNIIGMVMDIKNVIAHLNSLIPGLKDCLIDPIPDVRAASAKAVGSIMGSVGENTASNSNTTETGYEDIQELSKWLIQTLGSETSPVERSGAAQGIAEICLNLGVSKLTSILQEVLPYKNATRSAPREGLLWLLSFLPTAMHDTFSPFISTTLPVILSGLSDENEGVREVAMRAGQVMVNTLGHDYSFEILPSLRVGMFADDSRIRLSSVTLLGDLLYLISDTKAVGISSNAEGADDDEDIVGADAVGSGNKALHAIRHSLGSQVANTVFASLYIVRSDVTSAVRHMSLQVWKSVITNTPRTLLEIVEELVHQTIEKLSSESEQLRLVAGKALGEVVRKMGDRVLPVVMPLLQNDLTSPDVECRRGVCLGLSEILTAISSKQTEDYLSLFIYALQVALSDEDDDVRNQAARCFQILHKSIGMHAIEEIVPPLLKSIIAASESNADAASDRSFLALKELVQVRPRDLLEYLLPKLMSSSAGGSSSSRSASSSRMSVSSARVLGAIASACSHQLMYHFQYLVSMFAVELNAAEASVLALREATEASTATAAADTSALEREQDRFDTIKQSVIDIVTVIDTTGVQYFFPELGGQAEHETDVNRRRWGCWMLQQFLVHNKEADYAEYIPLLLRYILNRIVEFDTRIIPVLIDTFTALVAATPLDELILHIDFMKNCMSSVISDIKHRTGMQHIQYIKSSVSMVSDSRERPKEYMVLPLFSHAKSIEPFLTVFLHGLLNGNIKTREVSADCITDIISYVTDNAILKPYYIKTTGPLIRVLGDRYPSDVKSAILMTLIVLLEKGGAALKPFAPQLQTTFVKNLNDPSKAVRQRAVHALGLVVTLSMRIDPLINELCTLCQTTGAAAGASTDDNDSSAQATASQASITIKSSILAGIYTALKQCGSKALPASLDKVKSLVVSCLLDAGMASGSNGVAEDDIRWNIARCFASLASYVDVSLAKEYISELTTISSKTLAGGSGSIEAGRIMALAGIFQACSFNGTLSGAAAAPAASGTGSTTVALSVDVRDKVYELIKSGFSDERVTVRVSSCHAVKILLTPFTASTTATTAADAETRRQEQKTYALSVLHLLADSVAGAAADQFTAEVRKTAMLVIKEMGKRYPGAAGRHHLKLVPPLVAAIKDIDIRVKYAAERAMYYLFEGGNNKAAITNFEQACSDKETAKFVKAYVSNNLTKMSTTNFDSDNEN